MGGKKDAINLLIVVEFHFKESIKSWHIHKLLKMQPILLIQ